MPITTLGSLGKNRVGRVTGNTHISFFWPYWSASPFSAVGGVFKLVFGSNHRFHSQVRYILTIVKSVTGKRMNTYSWLTT